MRIQFVDDRVELLKCVRQKYNLTQVEMGELMGYKSAAQVHISRMENGIIPVNNRAAILAWYILKFGPLHESVVDNLKNLEMR